MTDDAPARLCTACFAPMAAAARFCSRCGAPVDAHLHPPRWPELKVALQLWVVLIFCSGGIGIAMHVTGSESPIHELVGAIASAVLVIAFALAMWRELAPALSPAKVTLRSILIALLAAGVLLGFIHLYFLGGSLIGLGEIRMTESFESAGWPLWSAIVMIGVGPAVFEEIAFRGIIYERLQRVGGPREALVVQAAMFSIIHLLPSAFISHFVIGLTLGWLRQRTGSLLPGMITHFVYNTVLVFIEVLH